MIDFTLVCCHTPVMSRFLDEFYTLSEEELLYRKLWEEGEKGARHIRLPEEVESRARLEERIVLSSSYYERNMDEKVIVLKHPCFMPRYVHSHQFVELSWVMNGCVDENIEGQDVHVEKGNLVVLMPGFYHDIWAGDERTVVINILADRDFFFSLCQRHLPWLASQVCCIFRDAEVSDVLEQMLLQDRLDDDVSQPMKEVLLEELLLYVKRNASVRLTLECSQRKEAFRILSYLEENYRTVTLVSFAEAFGITAQYASRLIREKTGSSFSQIIRKIRMEEASRLLRGGMLTSKEIAYEVGYFSPEHFSRTFKSFFGLSPEAWKEKASSVQVEHLLKRD